MLVRGRIKRGTNCGWRATITGNRNSMRLGVGIVCEAAWIAKVFVIPETEAPFARRLSGTLTT